LFADATMPEAKDVEKLDMDWTRWREEWKKRKKIFKELRQFICDASPVALRFFSSMPLDLPYIAKRNKAPSDTISAHLFPVCGSFHRIWSSITEHLSPSDASELAESLGIEFDSEEHEVLERGPLCQPPARYTSRTTGRATKQ
jgi:hypothetical protein